MLGFCTVVVLAREHDKVDQAGACRDRRESMRLLLVMGNDQGESKLAEPLRTKEEGL